VKRLEFIQKLQKELGRHRKDYFTDAGYVAPGCMLCKVRLNTNGQYLEHLLVDVLPGAVEMILNGGTEPTTASPESAAISQGRNPRRALR
jgi:hypothetical protein